MDETIDITQMRVQIRDRDALLSVSIANMRAYLTAAGWEDTGRWGERPVNVFAIERYGRMWEILVPRREAIGGYAENMANALEVLEKVEDRSQLGIFQDMVNAGAERGDSAAVRLAFRAARNP